MTSFINENKDWAFIIRFTLLHVLTYFILGLISFYAFNYTAVFASSEKLNALMRSTDSPIVQAGILFQFIRGPILAIAFFSLRKVFAENKYGWLQIFAMLWILTGIGAVITGPGSIEGMIYTQLEWSDHIGAGLIEVSAQMLLFSFLIWKWERKAQVIQQPTDY